MPKISDAKTKRHVVDMQLADNSMLDPGGYGLYLKKKELFKQWKCSLLASGDT